MEQKTWTKVNVWQSTKDVLDALYWRLKIPRTVILDQAVREFYQRHLHEEAEHERATTSHAV